MTNETTCPRCEGGAQFDCPACEGSGLSDKEEARRDFAHGNAAIDNPAVTREVIDAAADELRREASRDRQASRKAIADTLRSIEEWFCVQLGDEPCVFAYPLVQGKLLGVQLTDPARFRFEYVSPTGREYSLEDAPLWVRLMLIDEVRMIWLTARMIPVAALPTAGFAQILQEQTKHALKALEGAS